MTKQEHLEAAQKLYDLVLSGKLDSSEDIADALSDYEFHLKEAV